MEEINNSRRTFLKSVGLSAAALSLSGVDFLKAASVETGKGYAANIGIQLYTVRKFIEKDFEGTMKKIADTGYVGVETYFLPESITLQRAAKTFHDVGLKIFAMHSELPIDANREPALKMADAYKCDRLIYAGWPQGDRYKDEEAIKRTTERINNVGAFLNKRGIKLGLHNHWWEFEKVGNTYPFFYLLENLDKDIFFEIDTYWAKLAGQNPAEVVKKFGKRAPLLHIKDGPGVRGDRQNEDQMPAGKGVMDIPAIVKAAGKNVKWMVAEFDEYGGDIFEGIKTSYDYLTKNKLAKGNV
jgi:sugar phosphate isomerase/epimerase